MTKFTHKLLKKTAVEMAGAIYEEMARDNAFFAKWPNQRNYIRKNWQFYIKAARTTLAQMLGGNYPEMMKEEIFEALLQDRSLPHGDTSVDTRTVH